jgi:uncharacterized protein (TIGR02600 family)
MQTHPSNNRSGVALIVVLVFLVLLSVFIVSFFSNSQDELVAAQSFTGEVSAQQLADSAVSVVMGQIREATSRASGVRADGKYGHGAWGSQPGMIRVYGDGEKASSKADAFFKLYSSDDMIVSGGEIAAYNPDTEVPTGKGVGWNHLPAQWTNLNEAVSVPPPPGTTAKAALRYPILDPDAKKVVEGLEFAGVDFPRLGTDKDDSRELARMPVKWLYVLKDGTLTAPASTENAGTRAKWAAGQRAPTANNPIVGRIAFWTDDESCKVNINTAGGFSTTPDGSKNPGGMPSNYTEDSYAGSFWDTPRAYTEFDRGILDPKDGTIMKKGGLALSQPVRGEFQRYPGHPATTSMGVVFKNLLSSGQLAFLTPRLQYSFELGTDLQKSRRGSDYGTSRLLAAFDDPPDMRVKRIYSSVDELFFAQPDPSSSTGSTREQTDQELKLTTSGEAKVLTPLLLEQLRFFLTASSRAPELNLLGRPRMTIWPVFNVQTLTEENDLWNASDRLLAFCSTVGPTPAKDPSVQESSVKRFMFQRTPVRNGKPSGAYSATIEADFLRNRVLYDYLREVTSQPFPGFGGQSFSQKYAALGDKADRDQILTEIFDYIRCVNLRDSTRDKDINAKFGSGTKQNIQKKEQYKYAPRGLVVPNHFKRDQDTVGFGRFPTISEASLVLYNSGYLGEDNVRYLEKDKPNLPTPLNKGTVKVRANLVRAFLIFETFNPMQGYAPTNTANQYSYDQNPILFEVTSGLDNFKINGTSLNFPAQAKNAFKYASGSMWGGRNSGGSEGFLHTLFEKRFPDPKGLYTPAFKPNPATAYTPMYEFQSIHDPTIPVPGVPVVADGKPIQLSGAKLVLKLSYAGQPIHSVTLNFPDALIPAPTDEVWVNQPGGMVRYPAQSLLWACNKLPVDTKAVKSFNGRLNWVQDGNWGNYTANPPNNPPGPDYANRWHQILQPGDVVRSLLFGKKDVRVSCISNDDTIFQPHPNYKSQTVMHAQTLRMGDSNIYYPGNLPGTTTPETKFGKIAELPNTKDYPPSQAADISPDVTIGVRRNDGKLGDFDTGIGNLADGPFCGKADEGNLAFRHEIFDQYGKSYDPKWWVYDTPYFTWNYEETFDTFFTPNRQVPSPVVFGSLLAGKGANWQTLCFSPNPAGTGHPGRTNPKDYLWLDLFTMPVVEPYAISEPFSTAGKINLNYPIVPFYHIKRTTALRAALQGERITTFLSTDVIPGTNNPQQLSFKTGSPAGTPLTKNYRAVVDRDETLKAFDAFFNVYSGGPVDPDKDDGSPSNHDKGFFKSAAQICDFYLYPRSNGTSQITWKANEIAMKQYWATNPLAGDNVREKPYGDLYPRLTTKSNTYCVHIRAQALRQSAAADKASAAEHYRTWDEKRDRVIGEYRGSTIIERYIDPDDSRFDPATAGRGNYIDVDKVSLEEAYRFRVVNTKRFAP